jgi:DNA-binding NarL/FixJ family response regulator
VRDLFDALQQVETTGAGSLVLVTGEMGIGKTRLLAEFAARSEPTLVARGGCIEDVPYSPWVEALWWLVDAAGPELVDDLPRRVRIHLGRLIPQFATESDDADDDGQHLLFEAVVEVFRRVAMHRSLVLVIDDVHWIDPASAELLRYVAANLRRIPMLLVPAFRGEDVTVTRELIAQLARQAESRISLERLADGVSAEIAAYLLGPEADSTDVERIARDAGGVPLFVEELVAAVDASSIPPNLRELMLVRYSSLDDDARHLVRVAALIGLRAPRAWLVAASALGIDRARAAAREAVDRGALIASDDGRFYEFRHALSRQAVLGALLPDERVALHGEIAQALTDHPEHAVGIDRVAELARHWDAAEQPIPALIWQLASARAAYEAYAFEAAAGAYERALFWWDGVADAADVVGVDHAALLLDAADAAGAAGHVERAADLAWSGVVGAFALDPGRGVEAAGRAHHLMWAANRAEELFDFGTTELLPVLDRVKPSASARFLTSRVDYLLISSSANEIRESIALLINELNDVDDPEIEARAHMVNAFCYELFGEFDRVELEYERAAEVARSAGAQSVLALVLYNHAAFQTSIPDLVACISIIDEVDQLIERYSFRRYLAPTRSLRAVASCLLGELPNAEEAIASLDDIFLEGYDAWVRATARALIALMAGDYAATLHALDAESIAAPTPRDAERVIEISMLRANALAWQGDLDAARRAVDAGEVEVERHRETYWHGRLAMVGLRIEADAVTAASSSASLPELERAHERAVAIRAAWKLARDELEHSSLLVDAYSLAMDAEMARVAGENVREFSIAAANAFNAVSMPYDATYFEWRAAQAMLEDGARPAATELLRRARSVAHTRGFVGLEDVITSLARAHHLRLGPARTTVDGDEALSVREIEVLKLMADGKSNPDIAEALFISRRTAAAHVSNILRKIHVKSRVEAVSEAHRRGYV